MSENTITYEELRQQILNRFPLDDDIREGSPLAIAVSPTAYVLANDTLVKLEDTVKQSHALTADREQLLYECELYGITPYPATCAVAEGKFDQPCEIGDRFTIGSLVFAITGESDTVEEGFYFYYLTCEEAGDIGNVSPGRLIPVVLHQDLTVAQLVKIVINGENEEDTEALRERFRSQFNAQSYGGNVANYYEWLAEIQGVGRAKVIPCENPEGEVKPGYVTIVISDSNNVAPSEELIESVQEALCPSDYKGQGVGRAPIGADVYVVGVKEETIDISLTVEAEGNKSSEVKAKIEEYIKAQNLEWGNVMPEESSYEPKTQGNVHIRPAQLISAIFTVPGIIDVRDLLINGSGDNIDLAWDTIAKLGEVNETDRLPSS